MRPAIRTTGSSPRSWRGTGRRRCSGSRRARRGSTPRQTPSAAAGAPDFTGLAEDLSAAWNAPGTTMRTRQRLVRALVTDIVADVDEATREVVLVIHWQGGQHSELRVRKPRTGEHGCRTPEEALAVMRSMATRWSDEDIAASLNRMGMRDRPGQDLDGQARQLAAPRPRHPRLPLRREGRRVADHVARPRRRSASPTTSSAA